MRARTALAALVGSAALAGALAGPVAAQTGVVAHMTCLAPTDAAGIDAMLTRAASPLAGEGAIFVAAAAEVGLDPRALVAIAAHETMLETYVPSQAIHNPFGLGPGMAFATDADAIRRAARVLGDYYLAEGRVRIGDIGAKWAPLGVANDPGGLNAHWETGVGAYYAALGGDPARPVLAPAQEAVPPCAGAPSLAPSVAEETVTTGPPVVTVWGGAPPRVGGATGADGADPATGEPAVIEGFAFPLALPAGAPAAYTDSFSDAGPVECGDARMQCAITITSTPGDAVVAMAAGALRGPDAAEREAGIAFWIETPGGDRLGYGPPAAYQPGVTEGVTVAAGQHLGTSAGPLRVAWVRAGEGIDPFPLLHATRPATS